MVRLDQAAGVSLLLLLAVLLVLSIRAGLLEPEERSQEGPSPAPRPPREPEPAGEPSRDAPPPAEPAPAEPGGAEGAGAPGGGEDSEELEPIEGGDVHGALELEEAAR